MSSEANTHEIASLMVLFAEVVTQKSFTRAAERLGLSKSYLSKQIQRLESQLGTPLLFRTTRSLRPTDAGLVLYEKAQSLNGIIGDAEDAVRESQDTLSGHIRLTAPAGYGIEFLQQPLLDFLAEHPAISASIQLSNELVDVMRARMDLAIRIGPVRDQDLVTRRLCVSQRWVVAAPSLLEELGTPTRPGDLTELPCILYAYQAKDNVWVFDDAGERVEVPVTGRLEVDNDELAVEAAVRGFGFVWLPDFVVRAQVEAGNLVPLFSSQAREATEVCAVLPSRQMPKRVRALLDHLQEALTQDVPEPLRVTGD